MATPSSRLGDLLLKVTAPRVPKALLARARLSVGGAALGDRAAVLVQAPPGFGKTSLLAQWRLEHLARGAAVAWASAQPEDDVDRLVRTLALAVRVGAGRPAFGRVLLEGGAAAGLEGVTLWLAEVAQSAFELVLVLDEADRLPAAAREAVGYLVRNAPPNLRCIVAARADAELGLDDLVAYGQCALLGAAQLRFTLEETLRLAEQRLGAAFDRDRAARLHALTEGWPLGVQLALAADPSGRGPEPGPAGAASLPEQFVAVFLRKLDPDDLALLTRISVAQHLHPALCSALVPRADTPARLERLAHETPVFGTGELQGWMRMHSLARAALEKRFDALPAQERAQLHARASEWLAEQGLLEAAARHALACGRSDAAYDFAERSLYESLMTRGHPAAVLEWIGQATQEELERRPRLMLAAAWSLALGERHEEARRFVERILAQPGADDGLRCEAALILAGAAVYADDPDAYAALHDPWAERPLLATEALLQVHANRSAFRALLAGEPALARLRQQRGPHHFPAESNLDRWGEYIVALSYLWEGQPLMVDQLLGPSLASAEADLGRRSPFACAVAAALAAARWERGQPDEAAVLLADRLDVLERSGLPEAVLQAFRTLARCARAAGNEPRALALLAALDAVGMARGLPRLRLASLAEQVRLHAREFRAETCRELLRQMEQLLEDPSTPAGPLWRRSVEGLVLLARAHGAVAARDWRAAVAPLQRAEALAAERKQGRERLEAMALRAWVLDRSAERSLPLLQEVLALAQALDLRSVFDDAHPQLAAWARHAAAAAPQRAAADAPPPPPRPALPRAAASAALTPKEREVLELLARNLSNKEIALALQVGEETVKWHVKNLFAKLDAGTRKQVVGRARILGFLADAA
ncbi:MAG TPA: LuxR C-terminal-related transcriptional regulator [Ramlibacter sp.]|uniref:LuxR C-terminal-related transcriptional regulator n=1 Tax=Ramlibacter sp. TaxID=1917967 RepID=UPI002D7EEC9E|nr:LuxR C-terminal-related transcriptional regulator [Ramlibacter sp.]HET8745893.1 LuxR C-terminal-related transcriptional regulator [Ramlibacter sp.]